MLSLDVKQIADLLTLFRGVLAVALVWVGLSQGSEGLSLAVAFLLLAWTSDSLDGPLARRSSRRSSTWIGYHDLQFDMAVSGGLLIYLVLADFVTFPVALAYVSLWAFIFWRRGLSRSPAMLFQAPIYGWFISVALRYARPAGQWLIVWILGAVLLTWPRFPKAIIPDFLKGMQSMRRPRRDRDS
jgi:phosphatidylserine synthase